MFCGSPIVRAAAALVGSRADAYCLAVFSAAALGRARAMGSVSRHTLSGHTGGTSGACVSGRGRARPSQAYRHAKAHQLSLQPERASATEDHSPCTCVDFRRQVRVPPVRSLRVDRLRSGSQQTLSSTNSAFYLPGASHFRQTLRRLDNIARTITQAIQ